MGTIDSTVFGTPEITQVADVTSSEIKQSNQALPTEMKSAAPTIIISQPKQDTSGILVFAAIAVIAYIIMRKK